MVAFQPQAANLAVKCGAADAQRTGRRALTLPCACDSAAITTARSASAKEPGSDGGGEPRRSPRAIDPPKSSFVEAQGYPRCVSRPDDPAIRIERQQGHGMYSLVLRKARMR